IRALRIGNDFERTRAVDRLVDHCGGESLLDFVSQTGVLERRGGQGLDVLWQPPASVRRARTFPESPERQKPAGAKYSAQCSVHHKESPPGYAEANIYETDAGVKSPLS